VWYFWQGNHNIYIRCMYMVLANPNLKWYMFCLACSFPLAVNFCNAHYVHGVQALMSSLAHAAGIPIRACSTTYALPNTHTHTHTHTHLMSSKVGAHAWLSLHGPAVFAAQRTDPAPVPAHEDPGVCPGLHHAHPSFAARGLHAAAACYQHQGVGALSKT